MAYSLSTAFAIYFVLWWVVLFAVLPFGVRSQAESGDELAGTDPGAPIKPQMGRKLLWTTLISAVLFGIGMAASKAGILTVERLSKLMGLPL
jgi:predicted secreted protein